MSLSALRAALARRFLLKLKRATHRSPPRLFVPEARRVLVVAPHMDDEVISCAGTLLHLIAQGTAVHVAFASDSSGGLADPRLAAAMRATRAAEAARVGERMGFSGTTQLGLPDSQLVRHERALTDGLVREIERIGPDLILCPFPSDGHSDHMSCSRVTALAAERANWRGTILAYEVWTPLFPNVLVDITPFADRKAEAIRLYASQMSDRDYAEAALGLNRFRGLAGPVAYAEAFYRCSPAEFARLAALLDEI